jgi:hypothetical protein
MKNHTGEKGFRCEICDDKVFSQQCNLKRYMTSHTGMKNNRCEIFDKAFVHQCSL